MRIAHQGLF